MSGRCLIVYLESLANRLLLLAVLTSSSGAYAQVALNLNTGWNLLGNSSAAPVDVAATFGDASKLTTVWKWNKVAGKWAFYAPSMTSSALATYAQGKGYDVLTSIASKEGFWVNASTSVALAGPAASGVTLVEGDLLQGWNLVGSSDNSTPSQLNQSLGCKLNAAGKSIVTAWAWDAPTTNWRFYAPALEAQAGTALADYITSKRYLPFGTAISAADGLWLNIGAAVDGGGICPPVFTGLAFATANDTTSITVAWLDAQDAITPPAQIKYNIYASTDPQFALSAANLNQSVTGQKQSVITGLTAGTSYYIQVVAINQQGLSSAVTSAPTSVTTLTSPIVLSTTTPLVKATDLRLSSPTVVGTDFHYAYTGVETPPALGSILIGADANGKGYLTKVSGASITGGEVVVQTTQGTLSEAVTHGEINTTSTLFGNPTTPATTTGILSNAETLSVPAYMPTRLEWSNNLLTFEENPSTNLPAGVSVTRNPETGRYAVSASQASGGGPPNLKQSLMLSGSATESLNYDIGVTFTPQLTTTAKWSTGIPGVGTLQKGVLMASGTLSFDAKAIYDFSASGTYTKDVTFDVFTRTYTSVYNVGPMPVYQQVTLTLGAHLEAKATAAVNAAATANLSETVTFGVQYNPATGAWETVAPATSHSDSLTANLSVTGGVTSQIRLIPNIEVKFYKVAAANLSVEPVLMGNIQASAVANADFLAGSFPPGIIQLTAFDAALNAQCFVGANLQFWLSPTIPLLNRTQVCDIPAYTFFTLPTLALSSQTQANGTSLLTANVKDGKNDPFADASIKWTIYPTNAGTITPVAGQARQASLAFNPGVGSATIFFSGYGKLGELGRQFAQLAVNAIVPKLTVTPLNPSVTVGATLQLTATATDQQGNPLTISELTWTSTNLGFTVSSTGLVSVAPEATGTAVIAVRDPASGASATATVAIIKQAVINVTPAVVLLNRLATFTVTGTLMPEGMAFIIPSCGDVKELPGGNSTKREFTCMPFNAGETVIEIKDKPAGVSLVQGLFQVTVAEYNLEICNYGVPELTINVGLATGVSFALSQSPIIYMLHGIPIEHKFVGDYDSWNVTYECKRLNVPENQSIDVHVDGSYSLEIIPYDGVIPVTTGYLTYGFGVDNATTAADTGKQRLKIIPGSTPSFGQIPPIKVYK